jgi:iron complex transport system substrate-binding protein
MKSRYANVYRASLITLGRSILLAGLAVGLTLRVLPEKAAAAPPDDQRLVTLGSSVTETVFALGHGDSVVARDSSSLFPAAARELPEVGYYRNISAEGILAQNPDRVITTSEAGPPRALEQLRQAGVDLVVVEESKTVDGSVQKARTIAEALGEPDARVAEELEDEITAARDLAAATQKTPSVLFLMQVDGSGAAMAAGRGTGVDEMLRQAGAENAAGAIQGYRDLSAEAILVAAPDVVLVPDHLFGPEAGLDREALEPLLQPSPAWQNDRVHAVDLAKLAGFGPRTGQALRELVQLLHPSTPSS